MVYRESNSVKAVAITGQLMLLVTTVPINSAQVHGIVLQMLPVALTLSVSVQITQARQIKMPWPQNCNRYVVGSRGVVPEESDSYNQFFLFPNLFTLDDKPILSFLKQSLYFCQSSKCL